MNRNTIIFSFGISFCLALFVVENEKKGKSPAKSILGKWQVTNDCFYRQLNFSPNGTAVFDGCGDTIYRFNYALMSHDYLMVKNKADSVYLQKIERLTADSLILDGLINEKGRFVFRKFEDNH